MDANSPVTTASGLQYTDLVVGTGAAASEGATAVVHYTGWLMDGTKFDSSLDRGVPLEFAIGRGRVIAGWDEGVGTMNVGGKRELIILIYILNVPFNFRLTAPFQRMLPVSRNWNL